MIPKPKTIKNKVTKGWLKFRREYLKSHPANHEGYYECALCGKWVHESVVELDHIQNRSLRPDLRYIEDNIQLVHSTCNTNKKLYH